MTPFPNRKGVFFMKSFLLFLCLSTIFTTTSAFSSQSCEGTSHKHFSRVVQAGNDVEVSLSNDNFRPYRELGKFKISGKETSTIKIQDISLDTFMNNSRLAVDVFANLVLGRREFDGEYDIAWSYADSFFRSLKCN